MLLIIKFMYAVTVAGDHRRERWSPIRMPDLAKPTVASTVPPSNWWVHWANPPRSSAGIARLAVALLSSLSLTRIILCRESTMVCRAVKTVNAGTPAAALRSSSAPDHRSWPQC